MPGCDHISVEPLHGSWITRSVDIVLIQLISSLIPAFKPIIHSRKSPKKIYRKVINLSTPKPLAPQGAPFEKCVLLTHVNPRNFMKPFPLAKGSAARLSLSLVGMALFLGELATHLSLMLQVVFCKWGFGEGFGGNTEPHRVVEALGFGKKQQPFSPGQIPKGFENWPLRHDLVDLPRYKVLEDSETQPTTRRPKGEGKKH